MSCKLRLLFKSSLAMSPIFRELRQSRSTSKDFEPSSNYLNFFLKTKSFKKSEKKD